MRPAIVAGVKNDKNDFPTGSPLERELLRQRIGTNLELNHLAERSLPAFDMPIGNGCVVAPDPASFPAAIQAVDPWIGCSDEESHRIGDTQRDPFLGGGS